MSWEQIVSMHGGLEQAFSANRVVPFKDVRAHIGVRRGRIACRAFAETGKKDRAGQFQELKTWLISEHGVVKECIKLNYSAGMYSSVEEVRASADIAEHEVYTSLACMSETFLPHTLLMEAAA